MKQFRSKKFTESEFYKIRDMYLAGCSAAEISAEIGKSINVGNLQSMRRFFDLKQNRSGVIVEQILSASAEIVKLAELGYTRKDICLKLGLDPRCKESFIHWIPNFKTIGYAKFGPEIQSGVVYDYTIELMSATQIGKKYNMDSTSAQTILKNHKVLRSYRETHRLKKQAGKYNYTGLRPHRYLDKAGKRFSKKMKDGIITNFGGVCVCCYETNEQHKERLNKSLCVHHIYPYSACKSNDEFNLIPLCYECHKTIHKQMEANKDVYRILGSHFREGLDMAELFFDLFDTNLISDLKVAGLNFDAT